MINKITNKYYEYNPNEFLPIYRDGKIDNMRDFHLLKLKKAALALDRGFQRMLDAAYSK